MVHDVEDAIASFLHVVIRTDTTKHWRSSKVAPGVVTEIPVMSQNDVITYRIEYFYAAQDTSHTHTHTHLSSMRHLLSRTLQFNLKSSYNDIHFFSC